MRKKSKRFINNLATRLAEYGLENNSIPTDSYIEEEYKKAVKRLSLTKLRNWLNAKSSKYMPELISQINSVYSNMISNATQSAGVEQNKILKNISVFKKDKESGNNEEDFDNSLSRLLETFTEGMNVENQKSCSIDYGKSFQLSKSPEMLNIFNEDEIWQCDSKTNLPKLMKAKIAGVNSGGGLPVGIEMNPIKKGKKEQINYGDVIKMCNKKYKIKNPSDKESNEKITYGDRIEFQANGWDGGSFSATVNPNIYGINNVKNMTADDFSAYFSKYTYCGNSKNTSGITASKNIN